MESRLHRSSFAGTAVTYNIYRQPLQTLKSTAALGNKQVTCMRAYHMSYPLQDNCHLSCGAASLSPSWTDCCKAAAGSCEDVRSSRGVPASSRSTASLSAVGGNASELAARASMQLAWNCETQQTPNLVSKNHHSFGMLATAVFEVERGSEATTAANSLSCSLPGYTFGLPHILRYVYTGSGSYVTRNCTQHNPPPEFPAKQKGDI